MIQMRMKISRMHETNFWDVANIEETKHEVHKLDQVLDEEFRRSRYKISYWRENEWGVWSLRIELHVHYCFRGGW